MAIEHFRRVVVVCNCACDITAAVDEAASLAAQLGAALRGIYVEDENLRRLAALPFAQQVSLSAPSISEGLIGADVEAMSAALGAAMQRAVSEAATRLGLEWSFGRSSGASSLTALAEAADMLVVEGAARAFAGSWRPRSTIESGGGEAAAGVLVRCRNPGGEGTVVILPDAQAARQRLVAAARALAGADAKVTLIARRQGGADETEALRPLVPEAARCRVAFYDAPDEALAAVITALRPALVALPAGNEFAPLGQRLVAAARCDVLMLR